MLIVPRDWTAIAIIAEANHLSSCGRPWRVHGLLFTCWREGSLTAKLTRQRPPAPFTTFPPAWKSWNEVPDELTSAIMSSLCLHIALSGSVQLLSTH